MLVFGGVWAIVVLCSSLVVVVVDMCVVAVWSVVWCVLIFGGVWAIVVLCSSLVVVVVDMCVVYDEFWVGGMCVGEKPGVVGFVNELVAIREVMV